jgi:hypothetical protein
MTLATLYCVVENAQPDEGSCRFASKGLNHSWFGSIKPCNKAQYFFKGERNMSFRSLMMAAAFFAAASVSADVTEEQTFTYQLDKDGRVSVENINGSVTIIGGSGNEVEIFAVKKGKNQELLDEIQIIIDHSDQAIRIETEYPDKGVKSWFNWGDGEKGSVSYTISVPSGASLESIESVNGNLEISGVTGLVKAETVNGGIKASGLSSNAKIETVNGSVSATFASLSGAQKASCESVNGRVVVNLPSGSDASVSAETINGGIDGSDFGLETSKGFIGRELEGDIGDGSARLALSTVNGAIKINSKK